MGYGRGVCIARCRGPFLPMIKKPFLNVDVVEVWP